MPAQRILSIWCPRFFSDMALRQNAQQKQAIAVVEEQNGALQVLCPSAQAHSLGVIKGQTQRDALAIAPQVVLLNVTQLNPSRRLEALRRWSLQFSPWAVCHGRDGLGLDITGCAHLFGSEKDMADVILSQLADIGFEASIAIADTIGAAWAMARFAGRELHGGDAGAEAIDQEARATRARAPRRPKWQQLRQFAGQKNAYSHIKIVPQGQVYSALSPLPVAALRLDPKIQEMLRQLGLRTIGDLLGQPRAPLARRFGPTLLARLDQALGISPEPMARQVEKLPLAVRLSFPEPIGLTQDLENAVTRLVDRLCLTLKAQNIGARQLRLSCHFAAGGLASFDVLTAKPSIEAPSIATLLKMKLDGFDVGFGLDMMRLEALRCEPMLLRQPVGHLRAKDHNKARYNAGNHAQGLADLINRLGARLGVEVITRPHFNDTHIPEKTTTLHSAAFGGVPEPWPGLMRPRPMILWQPKRLDLQTSQGKPHGMKWQGQKQDLCAMNGPERLTPQWWLEDLHWRSGVRDYWDVTTQSGQRLWIFYAHGAAISGGWFCHGQFA